MLSKASWLPLAEKLALQDGRSRRVDHDCGSGRTLLLSREGNRLKAHCFRCNDWGLHEVEEPLADRIARLAKAQAADSSALSSTSVPEGVEFKHWPAPARLWFARAGLSSADAGTLGATYNESLARVVLPCGQGFWQARSIDGRLPKYLAPVCGKHYPKYGKATSEVRVTLTEDLLSAYKVFKAGGVGWCMLGTSLPSSLLADLIELGCEVNVWLDNDLPPLHKVNRGQIAAAKVVRKLSALGVKTRNIVTDRDPKLIWLDEIKELTS